MEPTSQDAEHHRPSAAQYDASNDPSAGQGALAGIRVLDLGTVYAAPIAAMLLGDHGADVIKVEHPRGDPARAHGWHKDGHGLWWKVISRNKKSVTLNLSRSAGRDVMLRLATVSDVLIENFRPGTLEKWGLGPEELHAVNPKLTILRVTGFGQAGPYAHRPAFGTLAEAMSGFAHQTGDADGPPTLPPFGLADGVAGLAGALAVTLALFDLVRQPVAERHGQVIDLALLEPLLGILGPAPTVYDQLGEIPGRQGNRSRNNAPRNAYRTADGRWVVVSASATSIAERIMTLVGRPDLIDEPWFSSAGERARRGDLFDRIVGSWIGERRFADVMRLFDEAGAAIAPVYDIEQLLNDPQVRSRGTITTVDDADLGRVRMQNVIFRMDRTPGGIRHTGRGLGADNSLVLQGLLGMDVAQVDELRAEGVI